MPVSPSISGKIAQGLVSEPRSMAKEMQRNILLLLLVRICVLKKKKKKELLAT